MLNRKKAAKRAAISATVQQEKKAHTRFRNETPIKQKPQAVLTRKDVVEAGGSGAAERASLIRSIGDHLDTRLRDIAFDDDIDADLFEEKRAQMMEEARLSAGLKQRVVSGSIATYLSCKTTTTTGSAPEKGIYTVRVAHNCNAVTCVAALGMDRLVFGDKSGKVYMVDWSVSTAGTGMAPSAAAEAKRHQKTLLDPPLPSGVVSIAVSDTRQCRPTTRDVYEKTTVDHSCTSYVAAGSQDGSISIWETLSRRHKGLLFMHHKPVTGLSFKLDTATLYSCSEDGTLRLWSVPQMMTMDKLYGHEGPVYNLDAMRRDTAATVGRDGAMRFWNLDAATQQAYYYTTQQRDAALASSSTSSNSRSGDSPTTLPVEAVAMLNESTVVVGAADGSIVVFDVNRRRPLLVEVAAHGYGYIGDGTGLERASVELAAHAEDFPCGDEAAGSSSLSSSGGRRNANAITALAAVPYADVFASASYDGVVRLWQVTGVGAGSTAPGRRTGGEDGAAPAGKAALTLLAAIPVAAIVTALRFSASGDVLWVALSKEPRRGRWVVESKALNGVLVIPLSERCRGLLQQQTGGKVEHVPAQLYGITDAAEEQAVAADEEMAMGDAAGEEGSDLSAELSLDLEHNGEEEEEEEDSFLEVGPDGVMQLRGSRGGLGSQAAPSAASKTKVMKLKKKAKSEKVPKVLRGDSDIKDALAGAAAATTKKTKKVKKGTVASAKAASPVAKKKVSKMKKKQQ